MSATRTRTATISSERKSALRCWIGLTRIALYPNRKTWQMPYLIWPGAELPMGLLICVNEDSSKLMTLDNYVSPRVYFHSLETKNPFLKVLHSGILENKAFWLLGRYCAPKWPKKQWFSRADHSHITLMECMIYIPSIWKVRPSTWRIAEAWILMRLRRQNG